MTQNTNVNITSKITAEITLKVIITAISLFIIIVARRSLTAVEFQFVKFVHDVITTVVL